MPETTTNDYSTIGQYLYRLHQETGGTTTWDRIAQDKDMVSLMEGYGITDLKTLAANEDVKKSYGEYKALQEVQFDVGESDIPEHTPIGYVQDKVMPQTRTGGLGYTKEGWSPKEIYKGGWFGEPVPDRPVDVSGQLRRTGAAETQYNPLATPYVVPKGMTLDEVNTQQRQLQKKQAAWDFNSKGGMLIRQIDAPLQYLKAGIILARGDKLPEDYTWFDPIRRVLYPKEGYSIDMRAISGMDWDTPQGAAVNLSGEFLLDPINHIGGWATMANKGIKITRGLQPTAKTIKVLDKSVDVFKATRKAKTLEAIVPHLDNIPVANRGKNVKRIIKGFRQKGVGDVVEKWGTRNQYSAKNPYRKQLDLLHKTGDIDSDIMLKAERWEMNQVLKDKPAYLKGVHFLPDEEVVAFAKKHKLPISRDVDGFLVVAKDRKVLNRVLNVRKGIKFTPEYHRELGLALGYEDVAKIVGKGELATSDYIKAAKNFSPEDVEKAAGSLRRYYVKNKPEMLEIYDAALSVARGESGKGKALFSLYEMVDDMKQIGTGPDTVLKYLGNADSYDDLLYRYRLLGVKNPAKSRDIAYLLKQSKQNPRQIKELFQEYTLLSDQIRHGHVGYGGGLFSGWGREGRFNLLKPAFVRKHLGNIVETMESYYHKARWLDKNFRHVPEVVSIQDGVVASRGLRNFEKTIERMQYGWEAEVMRRTSQSKSLRKEVLLDQIATMGVDGKDVLRGIEGLPTARQGDALTELGTVVKTMLDEGYTAEHGFREYGYLQNYLPRTSEINAKMHGSFDSMIKYFGSKSRGNVVKLGLQYLPEYESMIRRFRSTNMTVANAAQLARSEEAPQLAKGLLGKFIEYATIASKQGNPELAVKFTKDAEFFKNLTNLYELKHAPNPREAAVLKKAFDIGRLTKAEFDDAMQSGLNTFHKYLGPMEYNERTRQYVGKHINEYLKSKNAKRWGYEKGSTIADFKVWSEDMETILGQRMHKTHGSIVSGEYFGNFIKEFDIPRGRTKKAIANFKASQELARKNNSEIVNVHKFIKEGLVDVHGEKVAYTNAEWLLGKVGKGVHMDKRMVEGLMRLAGAEKIMDTGSIFNKAHSVYMQWWARSTLFGGRTTYLYNNAAGDTWKQFVAGVDAWHMSGMPAWQVILPEGKTFGGIGAKTSKYAPVGAADNVRVKYDALRGRWATKKEVYNELVEMKVLGGQYASTTFEEAGRHLSEEITPWGHAIKKYTSDRSVENLGKLMKSIPETGVYSVRRGEVPAFRRAAKHIEDIKRAGTYMYFRYERGYSKIDAQSVVYRIHYDYEKQNALWKSWMPFYYWNSKNISQEFANAFIKPGKYAALGKVVKTPWDEMFGYDSYPVQCDAEWTRGAGIPAGKVGALPLMANFSQLPPFAAQELMGILNSDDRMEGLQQALQALGGMTEPFIQITAEQIANEDFFTGKPIISGGRGVIPERGIRDFMGINIEDKPYAQWIVHKAEGLATPLGIVRSAIKTIDRMPAPAYTAKLLMGLPLGLSNPASHEYLALNEDINRVSNIIKNRESKLDPFVEDAFQEALNEEIDMLKGYKSLLTDQSSDINDLLNQLAVNNNLAKKAEKHQEYELQKELLDIMNELMEEYKEAAWERDKMRKEIERDFAQYIK